MNIKEIEERSKMTRANVRYYESQGLLSPERLENGYRDYSEEDLKALQKIKLLRMLDLSVEDIRRIQDGSLSLEAVLNSKNKGFKERKQDLQKMETVSVRMQEDKVSYADLSPEKYLDIFILPAPSASSAGSSTTSVPYAKKTDSFPDVLPDARVLQKDILPEVYAPFRRIFARVLDLQIITMFTVLIEIKLFSLSPASAFGASVLFLLDAIFLLFVEPLLLHLFGTTPGKWILGLGVRDNYGEKLTYQEALKRTATMWVRGMGLSLPPISLICLIISIRKYKNGDTLAWTFHSEITEKDEKSIRALWYILALLLALMITSTARSSGAHLKGAARTKEQFIASYNKIRCFTDVDPVYLLDSSGQLTENDSIQKVIVSAGPVIDEILDYKVTENGTLKEVTVTFTSDDSYIPSLSAERIDLIRSMTGSDPGVTLHLNKLSRKLESAPFEDLSATVGNCYVECHTNYSGYRYDDGSNALYPEEGADLSFCMTLTITRLD